jgi:hypothetical protein
LKSITLIISSVSTASLALAERGPIICSLKVALRSLRQAPLNWYIVGVDWDDGGCGDDGSGDGGWEDTADWEDTEDCLEDTMEGAAPKDKSSPVGTEGEHM